MFAYHAGLSWAPAGFLGVDVFFVISGFLITALLLSEWRNDAWLDVVQFWKRRALRLLPALFVLLVGVAIAVPLLAPDQAGRLRGDVRAALAYVSNWHLIFQNQSYFEAAGRPPLLTHLWSLAIEEQFYLVWPLILWVGLEIRQRAHRLVWWILAAAVASAGLMSLLYEPGTDPSRVYYGTDTRAGTMLVGAALACVWAPWRAKQAPGRAGRIGLGLAAAGAMAGLAWSVANLHPFHDSLYGGGFFVVAALAAVLVAVACHPGTPWIHPALGSRVLVWTGKRSYGIYLFHWPVLMLTRSYYDVPFTGNTLLAVRIGITLSLAALSYRFVEAPIRAGALGRLWSDLRRRQRLIPRADRAWVAARTAAVGIALVSIGATALVAQQAPPAPDFSAIEAASGVGPPASATTPAPTASVPVASAGLATTSTLNPGTPPSTEPPSTTTTATLLPTARVTGLGDSVLLEAKRELERRLPDVTIDAVVARQFNDLLAVARGIRDGGQLGESVILQMGNNGPVTASQFDEIMDVLRGAKRVVVINVKVPRPWEGPNNSMLAAGVGRWPNAVLMDWQKHGAAHPELFGDDGTHMGPIGVAVFVELILASL